MTIWVENRTVVRRPKFWVVGFVSSEKHYSEVCFFFWWVALRFRELTYSKRAHKLEKVRFLHARYPENEASLNYGTLHDLPEQNCLRNLER